VADRDGRIPLILDVDTGIDDALAILHAAAVEADAGEFPRRLVERVGALAPERADLP
jgi:hypothetical protein